MELVSLVGTHQLSGVETGQTIIRNIWGEQDNCQFVKFTLDGVHYMAIEDPDDGYRSMCRDLVISDEPPKYSFPPQTMICTMKERDRDIFGEEHDVIVMKDSITGEIVLEVGTGNYRDYYPYYHFEYNPEGMACNNPEISEDAFNRIIENTQKLCS